MTQRESKRQRLADEDVQNLQENNFKSEMKVVKSLLNWCFENTKIHKLKGKGSDSKKDNLLHWACEEGHLQIVEHLLFFFVPSWITHVSLLYVCNLY